MPSQISEHDKRRVGEILGGYGDWFNAQLLRLIAKCDQDNLETLRSVYPSHVAAYEEWYRGEGLESKWDPQYGFYPKPGERGGHSLMTEREWADLLQTYTTAKQVAEESLEGIIEHIEMSCQRGQTQMVATPSAGKRGLPPFHQELVVCDRGTSGCNLAHNDRQALHFSRMALERVLALNGEEAA